MSRTRRRILLTEALVSARHPAPGPDHSHRIPAVPDAAIRASLRRAIEDNGAGRDLWLFAYGSLLWHPDHDFRETRSALVHGWCRRFCLWQWAFRGTTERPCLMLALDAGGACRGIVHRVPAAGIEENLYPVFRRELRSDGYRPRWVRAATPDAAVRALTFVANRTGRRYAGRLADDVVADHVARACGAKGACADYLRRACDRLDELGIHDTHLWRIQALVARRMA